MAKYTGMALLVAGAALAGGNGPSPSLCEKASTVLPKLTCVESARGVALAADQARANALLAHAEGGANRFVERFGQSPVRYAVAEGPDAPISKDDIAALRKAGFPNVLPWLSSTAKRAQIESALRRAVASNLAGQSPDVIEAAVAKSLAQLSKSFSPATEADVDSGAIPHELGHEWFRMAYWPNEPHVDSNAHYGGPSPDWLDEMAAILMESPKMYDDRIGQFANRYRSYRSDPASADDAAKKMIDLQVFFAEEHPLNAKLRANQAADAATGTPRDSVRITATLDQSGLRDSTRFYLQSAVCAQYLVDRTGDPKVFARIGAAFARGETMAGWLANKEPKGKLPRDLKALQADWLNWLDQRFPAAPAKAAA